MSQQFERLVRYYGNNVKLTSNFANCKPQRVPTTCPGNEEATTTRPSVTTNTYFYVSPRDHYLDL